MLIVGLTGGIGCGKSSFCAAFSRLGVPIIDADNIAHDLSQPNSIANQRIAEQLGEQSRLKDGSLNRAWLRETIFNDPYKKTLIEEILHPLILQEVKTQIEELNPKFAYCILAVPLLFENNAFLELSDLSIVIDCCEQEQISRVVRRSSLTSEQVIKIIQAQMPRSNRNKLADYVINNDGALENIDHKVSQLHSFLLEKS